MSFLTNLSLPSPSKFEELIGQHPHRMCQRKSYQLRELQLLKVQEYLMNRELSVKLPQEDRYVLILHKRERGQSKLRSYVII
jgi:hypothetical protein